MAIEQMPNFAAPPAAPGGYGSPPGQQPYGAAPAPAPYGAPPPQPPGAFPPPGGGYGAPPPDQGGGFGQPQGGGFGQPQGGGFGAPMDQQQAAPGAYGAPPGGPGAYGAPPGAYGAPPGATPIGPGPGYGAPPDQGGGFGQPGGGQFGMGAGAAGAALANVGNPMAAMTAGAKPKVRNPMMTLLIPYVLIFAGSFLSGLSSITVLFAAIGSLVSLAGSVMFLVNSIGMLRELQNYTQDDQFVWWYLFIPCLNIYFMLVKVPEQVTKAKTKAGILQAKPTRGIVNYFFIFLHALASDLNDIAQS
jgi:hypothetical protein